VPTPRPSKDALDFIRKMQPKQARQVLLRILDLCQNPNPPDSKAIHGLSGNLRRLDSGEFRIAHRLQGMRLRYWWSGSATMTRCIGSCRGSSFRSR